MAERLQEIVAQIVNIRELETIVTAMRGIAASRAQAGRSLLAGIAEYTDVVSLAIGRALNLQPSNVGLQHAAPPAGSRLLIMLCSEQGFAGTLTERVLDEAQAGAVGGLNFVLGTRGKAIATERGVAVAWSAPMATRIEAIPNLANRLADAVYNAVAGGAVMVEIIYARSEGSTLAVVRRSLLPIDFAALSVPLEREPPLHTLRPDLLVERLAAEYVFAGLCAAVTYAFEAENTARMIAMASAKSNIEAKLAALGRRERQLRQQETTAEILELAAGAMALHEPA
jgi:F-type H+-transporting ATPase subunit gamma